MTDPKIFYIVIIVVTLLFIALFGFNAYTYNRIRNNDIETTPVTRAEASTLFWLNIVWVLVATAILVWAIIELLSGKKVKVVAPVGYVKKVVPTPSVVESQYIQKPIPPPSTYIRPIVSDEAVCQLRR